MLPALQERIAYQGSSCAGISPQECFITAFSSWTKDFQTPCNMKAQAEILKEPTSCAQPNPNPFSIKSRIAAQCLMHVLRMCLHACVVVCRTQLRYWHVSHQSADVTKRSMLSRLRSAACLFSGWLAKAPVQDVLGLTSGHGKPLAATSFFADALKKRIIAL